MAEELPELLVPDAAAWRAWLDGNHGTSRGVWLVMHKKGGSVTALTYAQALDEALCFGWIDGQAARRDEGSYRQRMTPRRSGSLWSARNVEHVARLEREGRMTEAGREAVRAAQADGRWERAYAAPTTAEVPADLAAGVAADPRAQAMFDVLTATNRNALIHRLEVVKRPETRTRKVREMVRMLADGRTPYPQRARPPADAGPS
ncbi:YdeI/OmpD-associated family protein [Georgenia sp. 10Sc9-8]|uniref:YdeI/OmpD-associated family protein n=1 Tax=Georgenia halotolerans TaxID=3028317 RepID=A0ABT5TY26_9MICO|nr:YdeI/OmpD-associated family protein [Georgenia halotolerans]